jgi:probable addiction module antidote protein
MKNKITDFDISEYLDSEEMIAAYLSSIIEDNDWDLLIQAIGHVAKARGMSKIAEESGLGRESLYKSFSQNSQPRFETVMKVLSAMHIKIQLAPETQQHKRRDKKLLAA